MFRKKQQKEAIACRKCRKLEDVSCMEDGLCDACATKKMHKQRELEMLRKEGKNK